ncbi:nitrilase family protein [Acuticoccus sp. I52.16.1]|uniref:nitrilase family protein n=1 Tax=Acuticoccus sp. I52.16.1 TaxID=2928472 RepID=UPI001FD17073|nr:nitrilase family protein [Acuticoccus sp. I52.16.1]UOM35041.1 nitrilase family protein [Acuticoccus sp. I52.16.1]
MPSDPGSGPRPGRYTVACIQFEPKIGEVDANLATIETNVEAAAARGASLVVLPELAPSGYVFESDEELARLAGPVPEGKAAAFLVALARRLGIHIVSGIAEAAEGRVYNGALLTGPDGFIGRYRKLHLWDKETLFFAPGDVGLPVFDTPLGKIGIAVCYDGWFPETFRTLADAGAQIVCIPTNWVPMPSQDPAVEAMANTLHKAAAHSNGIYIACADRVGVERGQPFIGQSLILGPDGWPLAGPAHRSEAETLLAEVDLTSIATVRQINAHNHVHADRRRDVYR